MVIKMKRLTLFLAVFMLVAFTACENSKSDSKSEGIIAVSELSEQKFSEYLTDTKYSNISISDNFYVNFPSEISIIEVSEPQEELFSEFYPEYKKTFEYLFPNREFKLSEMFYSSLASDGGYNYFTPIENNIDKLTNNELNYNNMLTYTTMPGGREIQRTDNDIYFSSSSPILSGGVRINKGVAYKLTPDNQETTSLAGWIPYDSFEMLPEIYSVNSDKVFKLLDKEIKISDAVNFAEDYLNNIPVNYNKNLETAIDKINVLKLDKEHYGYRMTITRKYKDIPFSTMQEGNTTGAGNYAFDMGEIFMVNSNDIDFAIGLKLNHIVTEKNKLESIISPEKALNIVSEKLSNAVNFELSRAQIIYSQIKNEETNITECSPIYEFYLYNSNDSKNYIVYVDSVSGTANYYTQW
jgi:hypothetical protein